MRRREKIATGVFISLVFFGLLTLYAYHQSREYLRGPRLTIETPADGAAFTSPLIMLSGTAENVAFFTLNGRQIFTDESGRFGEQLLLQEGYTIITLEAKDRFGHRAEKRLELVYKQKEKML